MPIYIHLIYQWFEKELEFACFWYILQNWSTTVFSLQKNTQRSLVYVIAADTSLSILFHSTTLFYTDSFWQNYNTLLLTETYIHYFFFFSYENVCSTCKDKFSFACWECQCCSASVFHGHIIDINSPWIISTLFLSYVLYAHYL
jgi:hypothetical protein